jgi:hypothetical protein
LSLGAIRAWGGTGAKEWYAVVLHGSASTSTAGQESERGNGNGEQ